MNNYTTKTALTLLAATTWGALAFAATDTDTENVTLSASGSDTSVGTGDYTGNGTITIKNTTGGHGLTVNLGSDFSGTLDFAGNFRAGTENTTNYQNFSESVIVSLSSTNATVQWHNTMYQTSGADFNNVVSFKSIYGINANFNFNKAAAITNGSELRINSGTTTFSNLTVYGGGNITIASNATLTNSKITVSLDSSTADVYATKALISAQLNADGEKQTAGTLGGNVSVTLSGDEDVIKTLVSGGTTFKVAEDFTDTAGLTVDLSDSLKEKGYSVSFSDGSISFVPEPSAFGLLAGLGALALVASRRRRTKRA